ncbi:hypothetical protein E2C01_083917 [Portunus trituberculatus]|uniref:Uncharacterized protein n=1 Tax=Portunus trituberculatus TaxID=210409 RepID=A0A5B7J2V1_PORTR|nr:hypothetical protein [Portunus trituberculatus]
MLAVRVRMRGVGVSGGGVRGDKCVWEVGRAAVIRRAADRTVLTTTESVPWVGVGVDEGGE